MSPLKRLIDEILQRSLWQAFVGYMAASFVVLQIVEALNGAVGLPKWVGPGALSLLVIGLPIVLATSFLQKGMTTKVPESPPQSLADAREVEPPRAPEPSGRHRIFTWRNTLIGSGVAFALLGLLTAAYLFMRAAGIGPAGTLIAQGVLEEGAEVLLADFESSDPDLAHVVTGALRIDLVQSPTIRLVSGSRLSGALRRMERDEDAPITGAVARELAVREGYGAIIEGEIGTVGSGYVLTASIIDGKAWEPLAGFRVTAKSEDDLIDAIEELSRDIRDKAGESLRSIQRAPGLQQVSTSSLKALQLYTRATSLEVTDGPGAVTLYERAVEIDPEFAMAHRKIGVALGNMGIRRAEQVAALTSAFDLRDRLPPAERALAEAYYYYAVVGDREATIRAYERLLEADPDNLFGLNNLGDGYMPLGRYEDAEALFERALAVEPYTVGFANLSEVRFSLGRLDDAEAALDAGAARLPEAASVFERVRVRLITASADYERAEAAATAFGERFSSRADHARNAYQMVVLHAIRGELRAAEDRLRDVGGVQAGFANPMTVARDRAVLALVRGDSAGAVRILLEAHEAHRDSLAAGDRVYDSWLPVLLEAGSLAEAEPLYEEWQREVPDGELGPFGRDHRRLLEARFAFARGAQEESIRLWQAYERECPGTCAITAALGLAGVYEDLDDTATAIAEYERFLNDRNSSRGLHDFHARGRVLERLGQLYDQEGDFENAAKYYVMFVELWAEADQDLQQRVQGAQARLEEILAERG